MTVLSDIVAASARLHNSTTLPNDEYDRRIRESVEYFRRLLSTKALVSLADDESLLNVRSLVYLESCCRGLFKVSWLTLLCL
jgi:hypothetical protein